MAELNMDCVRDLLLYLEENIRYRANGKVVPVKMKHIRHQMEGCSYEELFEAAKYICEKSLATVEGGQIGKIPAKYVFIGITTKGHEFIQAMREDTVWNRAKEKAPELLAKGIDYAIQILKAVGV